MNQRIDYTQLGGFPITQDVLDFMQQSYRGAFGALASIIGSATILSGVVVNTGTNTVSNGWIVYNGELMPFVGGTLSSGVVVRESGQNLGFNDGTLHTVLYTKFASCGSPATFAFSDLKQAQTLRDVWSTYDVKEIDCPTSYIAANFDENGLGQNERLGWAICNGQNGTQDRRGRFPVGYDDRAADPGNGWWDVLYNTIGSLGGQKNVSITVPQLPNHSHTINAADGGIVGIINGGSPTGNISGGGHDGGAYAVESTDAIGSGQAHENRPPFIVTLFIQKL